jgi:4-hydroxybenzoate polyprenyltransferase
MVSFFAALVPLMVLLFELPLLKAKYRIFENSGFNLNFLVIWFAIYALFAFLISFAREIVKDIQDIKGDSANAIRTLPVVYGIKISKFIVLIFLAAIVALLFYILIRFIHDPISLTYILPFILTPVIYTGWIVYKASGVKDYEKASLFCKITMLTGMLYSIIVKFVLLNVL